MLWTLLLQSHPKRPDDPKAIPVEATTAVALDIEAETLPEAAKRAGKALRDMARVTNFKAVLTGW